MKESLEKKDFVVKHFDKGEKPFRFSQAIDKLILVKLSDKQDEKLISSWIN